MVIMSLLIHHNSISIPKTKWLFSLQIFIKEVVNNGEDVQMDVVTNPEPPNQRTIEQTGASQHGLLLGSNHSETDVLPAVPEASLKPTRNGNTNEAPKTTKAFETQVSPSGKMQTSVKSFNKRKISQQKEKKATQMLAIVLGKQTLGQTYVKEKLLCKCASVQLCKCLVYS